MSLTDGAGATTTFPQPAEAAYGSAAGSADAGDADAAPVTFTTFYGAADPPATYGYLGGTTPEKAGRAGPSFYVYAYSTRMPRTFAPT